MAKQFSIGYAVACVNLAQGHGEDDLAEYLLEEAGLSLEDVASGGLSRDDMKVLRRLFANVEARRATLTPTGRE